MQNSKVTKTRASRTKEVVETKITNIIRSFTRKIRKPNSL
jgi:hypothetical protein